MFASWMDLCTAVQRNFLCTYPGCQWLSKVPLVCLLMWDICKNSKLLPLIIFFSGKQLKSLWCPFSCQSVQAAIFQLTLFSRPCQSFCWQNNFTFSLCYHYWFHSDFVRNISEKNWWGGVTIKFKKRNPACTLKRCLDLPATVFVTLVLNFIWLEFFLEWKFFANWYFR